MVLVLTPPNSNMSTSIRIVLDKEERSCLLAFENQTQIWSMNTFFLFYERYWFLISFVLSKSSETLYMISHDDRNLEILLVTNFLVVIIDWLLGILTLPYTWCTTSTIRSAKNLSSAACFVFVFPIYWLWPRKPGSQTPPQILKCNDIMLTLFLKAVSWLFLNKIAKKTPHDHFDINTSQTLMPFFSGKYCTHLGGQKFVYLGVSTDAVFLQHVLITQVYLTWVTSTPAKRVHMICKIHINADGKQDSQILKKKLSISQAILHNISTSSQIYIFKVWFAQNMTST